MVKKAFPGIPVQWAYTSHIIRHKLAKQGQILLSPAQAMAKMADEGFYRCGCSVSAHNSRRRIPCHVWHDQGFPENAQRHSSHCSRPAPAQLRCGHERSGRRAAGKHTQGNANHTRPWCLWDMAPRTLPMYIILACSIISASRTPMSLLALWKAPPRWMMSSKRSRRGKIKKAYVMPFMSVAGDHARRTTWPETSRIHGSPC